jgi:hypothetical protein
MLRADPRDSDSFFENGIESQHERYMKCGWTSRAGRKLMIFTAAWG